jgi:hypothetical protein
MVAVETMMMLCVMLMADDLDLSRRTRYCTTPVAHIRMKTPLLALTVSVLVPFAGGKSTSWSFSC